MENNVTIILEDEHGTTTKEMSAEDFSKMVVARSTTYNNNYQNVEAKLRKISEAIKLISSKNKNFGGITCLDNYETVTLQEAIYSHQDSSVSIPDIVRFDMLSIDDVKNLSLCLKMIKKEMFDRYQLYRIEMVDSEDIFKTISESSIMFFKSELHYISGKSTIKFITSDSMKLKFINVKFFGGYKIGNFSDALNEVMNCMPPQQLSADIIDDYDGNYKLALI